MENEQKVEAIERFLDKWEQSAIDYYKRSADTIRAEMSKYQGKSFTYQDRMDARERLAQQYGKSAVRYAVYNYNDIEKDMSREKEAKRKMFYKRVTDITGQITDATYLSIGDNGEINGVAIGTDGKANVNTISAGGYNIQCFRFRVLVKKI